MDVAEPGGGRPDVLPVMYCTYLWMSCLASCFPHHQSVAGMYCTYLISKSIQDTA